MIELRQGNCLEIMQDISDKSIDCIICDLPYGTTACKWDSIIPLDKLWSEYERIITTKGAIILFGQEPFSSILRTSNLPLYRYDWIWKKQRPSNFQLMGYQCGRLTENILVFSKAKACYVSNGNIMTYYPQTVPREKVRKAPKNTIYGDTTKNILHNYQGSSQNELKYYKDKQPVNVLEYNTVEKNKLHPTQKPLKLIEYLIKTYTQESDLVLDNCMGSGTTGVACKKLNRNFIGIELDNTYYEIAKDRINNTNINIDK